MNNQKQLRVAVLGATGLVGEEMIRLLEQRDFPIGELRPLASRRSADRQIEFRGKPTPVQVASPETVSDVDIVLASAGGDVSRELLPHAATAGAICIDNTSAFRMDPDVPLVVPEVNGHRLEGIRPGAGGKIIANPNCSTIQLVVALAPLHERATLRRVVVSTYQSMSGAGRGKTQDFGEGSRRVLDGRELVRDTEAGHPFDVLPEIGGFSDDGDSTEERKMIRETPKILESQVDVDVCCVRVPVFRGHAESVWVETVSPISVAEAREVLKRAPGVELYDGNDYPTPRTTVGTDPVHVGRIRPARTATNGLQFWVVADNLLKGAALNAVQIAETMIDGAPARRNATGAGQVAQ